MVPRPVHLIPRVGAIFRGAVCEGKTSRRNDKSTFSEPPFKTSQIFCEYLDMVESNLMIRGYKRDGASLVSQALVSNISFTLQIDSHNILNQPETQKDQHEVAPQRAPKEAKRRTVWYHKHQESDRCANLQMQLCWR